MTLQQKLSQVGDALVTAVGENVYHYWRPNMTAPFCVWAEDTEESDLNADGVKVEQAISGYIDYFTKTEYDSTVDAIGDALKAFQKTHVFTWLYDSVQYEDDTNLIHHQWLWRLL